MTRKDVLVSLIEFDSTLESISERLQNFDFDSEEIVSCLPQHVRHVLQRYVEGALSSEQVEHWANLIEGRDDIQVSPALIELVHELANPMLTQELSVTRASQLIWLVDARFR